MPRGIRKVHATPAVVVVDLPGPVLTGVRPVLQTTRFDLAVDGVEVLFGNQKCVVLSPDFLSLGDVRVQETERAIAADGRLATMSYPQAVLIGSAQILALLPGISRDGVVTVAGLFRGFSRADAVRFSFLLSAPVILAAGVLKVPDLTGPLGAGVRGQVLAGSLLSFVGAYLSVRFLTRYFAKDRPLTPFAVYCLAVGLGSTVYLLVR